ncbi:MAG: hypothetical protein SFU86_08270 [Pirellulaceae bacterium]|nr:hypothetical protein [Pirellulaceae bacterium]
MSKKKPAAKKSAVKRPPAKPKQAAKKPPAATLGRPLCTQDEKLYLLFHEDFHARQIFEFLRAETVADLERFTPDEIVRRLSQPIADTVERIRNRLAEKNRHLAGDLKFALKRQRAAEGK